MGLYDTEGLPTAFGKNNDLHPPLNNKIIKTAAPSQQCQPTVPGWQNIVYANHKNYQNIIAKRYICHNSFLLSSVVMFLTYS